MSSYHVAELDDVMHLVQPETPLDPKPYRIKVMSDLGETKWLSVTVEVLDALWAAVNDMPEVKS